MSVSCLLTVVFNAFREHLRSSEFLKKARTESRFFTRQRCMSLEDCVLFLLTMSNRSLQTGLNDFLQKRKVCSKQAFSQKRRHIRPQAFLQLAELVRDNFYEHAKFTTWKGFRLLGVDGSKLNLPDSSKFMSRFGAQPSSGNQIQCLLSAVYDVLNQQVISVRQERWDGSERSLIDEQIREETCFRQGKDVFVLDRGYPSAQLISIFQEKGHLFVMRATKEFLKRFDLTSEDCIVNHSFSWNSYTTTLRVLTITLQNGLVEYLVTNILDLAITVDEFANVYHARWEIEQWFRCLKSTIEGENISGLDEQTFLQDLYADFILLNLNGVLFYASKETIVKNPRQRKYAIKPNRQVMVNSLRNQLCSLLTGKSIPSLRKKLVAFLNCITRFVVDVRPGRSYPRVLSHRSLSYPTNQRH